MKLILILFMLCATPALGVSEIKILREDNVTAGAPSITDSIVIPAGVVVTMKKFGCADPPTSGGIGNIIKLRWGSVAGGFETILPCTLIYEFKDINRDVMGDGVKHFRISRENKGAGPKTIFVWFNALVRD